jgi:hypothetical protein
MFVPARSWGRRGAAAAALALLAACAPKQHISLDSCVDEQVVVYVDGRLLDGSPGDIALRADEPHKLYVKRPGEAPRLVVLDSTADGDGRPRLVPADPCAELVAIGLGRELQIEVEDEGGGAEPAPAPTP